MDLYQGLAGLALKWKKAVEPSKGGHLIASERLPFRGDEIDELIYNAVFNQDVATRAGAKAIIAAAASTFGVKTASIRSLYEARGRGEISGFTVPAINLRGLTYDVARAAFRVAQKTDAAAMIFELARSEVGYTLQRPSEYASCIMAAALREGWSGPLFLQGDHYQVNAVKFADPETRQIELKAIADLITEAVEAGIRNIDIDASTLVDLRRRTPEEQQRDNYEICARYTRLIREIEPKGVTISVGGEIGEVGGKNSTVADLNAFMAGYRKAIGSGMQGLSKISVQTGSSHGGIPLPGGGLAQVKIDFTTLAEISKAAREQYGLAGAVQHGASTLPSEFFHHFPETETAEIHLATEFQNIIFDHRAFPRDLREQMAAWCDANCTSDKKEGQTPSQFFYKTRKKAWGPFKKQFWTLKEKDTIIADVEAKLALLWKQLNVGGSRAIVERYVKPVDYQPSVPAGFNELFARQ